MVRVFVDTSAWVAYFLRKDKNHILASELIEKAVKEKNIIVISDYILDECITTMLARTGHRDAVSAGEFILKSSIVEILWLDMDLKLRAWQYFKRHRDKRYSFTDCTSFVLMKERGIKHYIAFDEHFSRAGFVMFH